jgi:hypothetical protein
MVAGLDFVRSGWERETEDDLELGGEKLGYSIDWHHRAARHLSHDIHPQVPSAICGFVAIACSA